jgi:hypothetical protein
MSTFEDDQVEITDFTLIPVDRNIIFIDEFAAFVVVIGECRFKARLSLDRNLRLPRGVSIPDDLHQRAIELAKQAAMAALNMVWWGRARRSGSIHMIREQEATLRECAKKHSRGRPFSSGRAASHQQGVMSKDQDNERRDRNRTSRNCQAVSAGQPDP